MNSVVKYLKVIGGTSGKEQILVGLHNGQVFYFHFLLNNVLIEQIYRF